MRFSGFGNVKLGTFKAVTTSGSSKLRPQQTLASWAVLHNPSTGTVPIQWGPDPNEYLSGLDLGPGKWYNLSPEAVFDLAELHFKAATGVAGVTLEVIYAYQA